MPTVVREALENSTSDPDSREFNQISQILKNLATAIKAAAAGNVFLLPKQSHEDRRLLARLPSAINQKNLIQFFTAK
jgi:hypothetical protein